MPAEPRSKPEQHGVEHFLQREPGLDVQLGGEPHLGVHDAVGGEVLGALVRHPLERVGMLHDADRVGERLEVEHQVVALGAAIEPGGQVVDVVGREFVVAVLCGQLHHGRRAQPAVEVIVQEHLGSTVDQLVDHRATVSSCELCQAQLPTRSLSV